MLAVAIAEPEQHPVGVVELALVGHGEAEVVARLRFLPLELAVDRDLEVFLGTGTTPRELPPPQVELYEVAERVRDRRQIAGRPRLLEQGQQPVLCAVRSSAYFSSAA